MPLPLIPLAAAVIKAVNRKKSRTAETQTEEGTVSLLEKKVVLSSSPEREFHFLSKNKIGCTEGKTQHIYQRLRRGARIMWLDLLTAIEPSVVTGDLGEQLELAYNLMEAEKYRVQMEKFVALSKKAKAGH
jgi:hypothetical protein